MRLIVGLGNPGPTYAGNRHNIGFAVADAIVRRHGFSPYRARHRGQAAEGTLAGEKVLVLKPLTYMNLSGESVGDAVRFYKLALDQVYVAHDEIDLAAGKVRVKRGGGHAGHNGLRSIDSHVGKDYWRVRIGVGHPGDKDLVERYVLSDFRKEERPLFEKLADAIADAAPCLIAGEEGRFMNRVRVLLAPPRPKERPPEGGARPAADDGDDGL